MHDKRYFSVRVYGLWVNDKNQVLITDEYMLQLYLTKFPGGGLEFGEGIHDCLKREWQEELNIDINIKEHFYTTDFFQVSVFNPDAQIISVYYLVEPVKTYEIKLANKPFEFEELKDGSQSFRFLDLETLNADEITLPIDKTVAVMLKEKFKKSL